MTLNKAKKIGEQLKIAIGVLLANDYLLRNAPDFKLTQEDKKFHFKYFASVKQEGILMHKLCEEVLKIFIGWTITYMTVSFKRRSICLEIKPVGKSDVCYIEFTFFN